MNFSCSPWKAKNAYLAILQFHQEISHHLGKPEEQNIQPIRHMQKFKHVLPTVVRERGIVIGGRKVEKLASLVSMVAQKF
jgi:hypothetical protein